ncbi:hypothetical protein Nepgr_010236 [Nepenthes gracilis]|uniref:RING-type E3 ubiquitin transferase n=1 Tax=Nepenthes gracilis TaxID=150966 RepID=A0AAD3SCQ2_NEPGR|nr:hypothetical protein Nepgr_010236 [Nepenthes gracilis]
MGISWSSGRRNSRPYYQNPPASHQLAPSTPYYYGPEPSSSLPPPLPPGPRPPPPLPPQNYVFAANAPYPTTQYSFPPPNYYYRGFYNPSNYSDPLMGVNQSNGWPQIAPSAVSQPPPYVEHQAAKKVKNDVNVRKETIRLVIDEGNPDHYLVSFVFDALFDGSITVYYFAKEEANCKFTPIFPEAYMPVKIPFQKGLGQKFQQPSGEGIDLGFFELEDLAKPSPDEDVYPLVISAEVFSTLNLTDDEDASDNQLDRSPHIQITQAVLEKKNDEAFQVKVMRQILWIDGVRYELRDLYGLGNSDSHSQGFNDDDPGKECVICMTEPKDTAVLPCRHLCMCSECAKELRLQSDKCPICRQPIEELIEIRINTGTRFDEALLVEQEAKNPFSSWKNIQCLFQIRTISRLISLINLVILTRLHNQALRDPCRYVALL